MINATFGFDELTRRLRQFNDRWLRRRLKREHRAWQRKQATTPSHELSAFHILVEAKDTAEQKQKCQAGNADQQP